MTEHERGIHCLFYLHNTFENNHYALASFITEMRRHGVRYSCAAKRFLDNGFRASLPPQRFLLPEVPVWDGFWQRYDMLHAIFDGNPSLALCMTAYAFGVPYVLSFHGGYDTNCKIFDPSLREKLVIAIHCSRYTTVVCASDRRALEQLGCEAEKLVIAPPAIDPALLPRERGFDLCRAAVVGRFIEKKGIDTAVRALPYLPPEFSVDIIGDGELREELHALARQLRVTDRIRWHGELPLDETLRIIAADAFFWHPARKASDGNAEGIPQILIYALALGRFCVSTYSGHIQDLMEDQENGILIEQDRPELLAEVTEERRRAGAAPAKPEVGQYSIQDQVRNWKRIYLSPDELPRRPLRSEER